MNPQIFGKTKDVVIRQVALPTAVLSHRVARCRPVTEISTIPPPSNKKNSTPPPQFRRRAPRRAIEKPPCVLYCTPDCTSAPSSSFSDLPSNEHVLLFDGDKHNPDQEKVLALSRMFDNILREIPRLLDNHDYTIYTDDLEFISHLPMLRTVHGRQSYKVGLTAWFRSLTLLYTDLYIDVLEAVKEKESVSVRWAICGNSRINSSFVRVFDGTSTFYPERTGLIKTHILDKVAVDKWRMYQTISMSTPSG
ncbi:uncharacterized protein C6orf136 homolog [Bolinopsis microptera]|uniref:uncharacterized protein C6orf136 homolog n=1 Tax=Bolinopsis microptera TaxID=2820187 RepID=UPI00307A9735